MLINSFCLFFWCFSNQRIRKFSFLYYPVLLRGAVFLHLSGTHMYLTDLVIMQISLLSHCSYYIVIFNLWFYNWWSLLLSISSNRFFQKRNGLSDRRVASMTKIEYSFVAHFLYSSMKSLESMPIFVIKNVVLSLTSFGTGKTVMNTKMRFSFQSLINNSSEVIYY